MLEKLDEIPILAFGDRNPLTRNTWHGQRCALYYSSVIRDLNATVGKASIYYTKSEFVEIYIKLKA